MPDNIRDLMAVYFGGGSDAEYDFYNNAKTAGATANKPAFKGVPHYDVRGYGAKGDGLTDSGAAINAAIDACVAGGGGTVYVPPGEYLIETTVTIKDRTTLLGQSVWSTQSGDVTDTHAVILKAKAGLNNDVVRFAADASNAALYGVCIDGNKANQTGGHGVHMLASASAFKTGNRIDSVAVRDAKNDGIKVASNHNEVRIENVLVESSGGSGINCAGQDAYLRFVYAGSNGTYGVLLDTASLYSQIDGADLYGNGTAGLIVNGGGTNRISGLNVHSNVRDGIVLNSASNTRVFNSIFRLNSRENTGTKYSHVKLSGTCTANTFLGCHFEGDTQHLHAVNDTQTTPSPQTTFVNCAFTGTYGSGALSVGDVFYRLINCFNLHDTHRPYTAAGRGIVVKGLASQTGRLVQVLNDANGEMFTVDPSGNARTAGGLEVDGNLDHDGANVGFYGAAPAAKPTVTGAHGSNAALQSLLSALATLGLITDSTTA